MNRVWPERLAASFTRARFGSKGRQRCVWPFACLVVPAALDRIPRKLARSDDGDRQMVKILAAALTDGLAAVEAACLQALSECVHSADVVLNILARRSDPGPPPPIQTPAALSLRHAPVADCARYDSLRSA